MDVMKLMVVALAVWINQQQEDVIEYLREEVRILKELQGKRRETSRDGTGTGAREERNVG